VFLIVNYINKITIKICKCICHQCYLYLSYLQLLKIFAVPMLAIPINKKKCSRQTKIKRKLLYNHKILIYLIKSLIKKLFFHSNFNINLNCLWMMTDENVKKKVNYPIIINKCSEKVYISIIFIRWIMYYICE